MRRAERSYTNRNDRRNAEFVQTYLDNFQQNRPMPDAKTEWQLDSMLIKALNVEAVNAFAQQAIYPNNQVIVITAPEKEGVENPTTEEILAIRDKVAAAEIEAYEDNTVKEPLIPEGTTLEGSPVKKTAQNAEYGTTEWTLANGVKVIVKPTAYKADEVRMSALAKGGLSILSDEEFYMGEMMPAFNSMSGVGKFSATDLKKQLSGKSASVQPSVENYASAMNGVCSPKDLETMFQLLYLNFTQPRFDENDYNTLMKMLRAQLENVKSNPDYLMEDKFIDVAYGNNRAQMVRLRSSTSSSFEALPAIYKKLYTGCQQLQYSSSWQRRPRNAQTSSVEKIYRLNPDLEETDDVRGRQMRSREGRGDRGLHGLDATAQGFGTLHVLRRDALHAQEQGCPVVPDAGAQLALSGFDPRGEGRHVRRTSIRFDGIHPERDLQHDHFVRHQRGDGRRAARDRNEGDRRDRRQRPQERRHREKPRVHAQELEKTASNRMPAG